jgi:hypothetical protein
MLSAIENKLKETLENYELQELMPQLKMRA